MPKIKSQLNQRQRTFARANEKDKAMAADLISSLTTQDERNCDFSEKDISVTRNVAEACKKLGWAEEERGNTTASLVNAVAAFVKHMDDNPNLFNDLCAVVEYVPDRRNHYNSAAIVRLCVWHMALWRDPVYLLSSSDKLTMIAAAVDHKIQNELSDLEITDLLCGLYCSLRSWYRANVKVSGRGRPKKSSSTPASTRGIIVSASTTLENFLPNSNVGLKFAAVEIQIDSDTTIVCTMKLTQPLQTEDRKVGSLGPELLLDAAAWLEHGISDKPTN